MVGEILRWLLSTWLLLAPPGIRHDRLERQYQFGGPIRAAAWDGTNALVAEGDSIVRVPLVGPRSYQPIQRLTLDYGPILDLDHTGQTLYAITSSHLLVLDDLQLRRAIPGGGERLRRWENRLVVTNYQAGARLYDILPDGDLAHRQRVNTPTETHDATFVHDTLLVMAERSAGLRLVDLERNTIDILPDLTPASRVATFDTLVYTSANHRIHVVDSEFGVVGHYAPIHAVQSLAWSHDTLLAADGIEGLKAYAAAPDAGFRYLKTDSSTEAYRVAANARWVVSSQANGIHIYDARRLPELHLVGQVPLWNAASGISITPNDQALVALGPGGLAIVELGTRRVVASIQLSGPVQYALAHPLDSTLLYLTLGDGRLVVLRIDPAQRDDIEVRHDHPLAGQPGMLATDDTGTVLAIATGRAGLRFVSSADLQPLAEINPLSDVSPGITHVQHVGSGRWLVLDGDIIRLLKLTDTGLRELAQQSTTADTLLAISERLAISGAANRLDMLSLDYLDTLATYQAPTGFSAMQALLGVLIATDQEDRLWVLDMSDARAPQEQRMIPVPFTPSDFALQGDDLLLVHPDRELVHLRLPLLYPDRDPTLAGAYRSIRDIQRLLMLDDGRVVFASTDRAWGLASIYPNPLAAVPPAAVQPDIPLNITMTAWHEHHGRLLVGSQAGELWDVASQQVVASELGGPIQHIQTWHGLLVSAGPGGLWWLDDEYQVLSHYALPAMKTTTDGDWIALAAGRCGLHVLDADLRFFAGWGQSTYVTDVLFHQDTILALADGIPASYRFYPQQPPSAPPAPYNPQPPPHAETDGRTLRWQADATACMPLRYEVWLDGHLAGTTTGTEWQLPDDFQDLRWQIVVVDVFGNRNPGPEWQLYAATDGWLKTPTLVTQAYQPDANRWPSWWWLGLLMAGLGILFVLSVLRRRPR